MIQIVEFTISRTWFGLRIEISNFNPYFAIHQPFSMLWLKSLFFSPEFEYLTKSSVHVYVSFISCRFRAMINYCQIHINIRMLIIFRHMLQINSALLVYLRVLSTLSLSLSDRIHRSYRFEIPGPNVSTLQGRETHLRCVCDLQPKSMFIFFCKQFDDFIGHE